MLPYNSAATTIPTTPARAMCDAWSEAPALGAGDVSEASDPAEVAELPASVEPLPDDVDVGMVNEEAKDPVPVPVGKYEDVEFALNDVKLFVTVEVATLCIVT
ncbi:hypothetical protein SLS62_005507 [Diatrype stigma]|uniref:Uncharacterized protein n=1 Tax=Diatrype stigma TaxID=117547 RepID=A0AAN9YSH4_9PEZI